MTVPNQSAVTYAYDAASRLTAITQGSGVVQFAYDAANRRTTLALPNGVSTEYGTRFNTCPDRRRRDRPD